MHNNSGKLPLILKRNMQKRLLLLIAVLGLALLAEAQDRVVQNRPYTDLRTLHFGVLLGTHLQDLEFVNRGPNMVTDDNGTAEKLVTVDDDRWDAGFTVGVLAELRLNQTFQLRVAPALYFGTRHLTFHNFTDHDGEGNDLTETQTLKTAYISCAFDLIAAAPRFNNYRPYFMAGINPVMNLTGRDNDYIKLKRGDAYLELGFGCDFYLPFFKLRPELKFMYGLSNCLDTGHAQNLRNRDMIKYADAVTEAHSKIIALTFYFE